MFYYPHSKSLSREPFLSPFRSERASYRVPSSLQPIPTNRLPEGMPSFSFPFRDERASEHLPRVLLPAPPISSLAREHAPFALPSRDERASESLASALSCQLAWLRARALSLPFSRRASNRPRCKNKESSTVQSTATSSYLPCLLRTSLTDSPLLRATSERDSEKKQPSLSTRPSAHLGHVRTHKLRPPAATPPALLFASRMSE